MRLYMGENLVTNAGKKDIVRRGATIYTFSQLIGVSGRDKTGDTVSGQVEIPLFYLDPEMRIAIFQQCAPIFGVVTSRMNRISGLGWKVTPDKKNEDKIVDTLRSLYQIYQEYPYDSFFGIGVRMRCAAYIRKYLFDVLPDLSNFDQALWRYRKRIVSTRIDIAESIEGWLSNINAHDTFQDFVKKYVFDLLVHGAVAGYLETVNNRLENVYILPGGSIYPLRTPYVSSFSAYVQNIFDYQSQVYFSDEVMFRSYVPSSSAIYGFVPLDALINKISETLLLDQYMAQRADGTRPPEKMVIFGEQIPVGDLGMGGAGVDIDGPIDQAKLARLETVLNEVKKEAVRVLSGVGQPMVVDLSKSDTLSVQNTRQDKILKDIALVFNMSNMEVNISGGDGTSGRSTAESQAKIENAKGMLPIVVAIEEDITNKILLRKYGPGYSIEFDSEDSEEDRIKLLQMKVQSGLWSTNELRTEELAVDPFNDPQFNNPPGVAPPQPGSDQNNPMFTQQA